MDPYLRNFKTHIFLSPHLDDAALSCGGTIAFCNRLGLQVYIITVFSGATLHKLSSFAKRKVLKWGCTNPLEAYKLRIDEDQKAALRMGMKKNSLLYMNLLDAIYRIHQGRTLYPSRKALFGRIDRVDFPLIKFLKSQFEMILPNNDNLLVYAPLALGNHVDHQLVHQSVRALNNKLNILFYEDMPYALESNFSKLIQSRIKSDNLSSKVMPIDTLNYRAKIDAFKIYSSQFKFTKVELKKMFNDYYLKHTDGHPIERYWIMK